MKQVKVTMKKVPGCDSLGIAYSYSKSETSVVIDSIGDGLVSKWNRENPTMLIHPKDVILACNGKRGNSDKIMDSIKEHDVLEMEVCMKGASQNASAHPPHHQNASAHNSLHPVGTSVEYFSQTHQTWVATTVQGHAGGNAYLLNCTPGRSIHPSSVRLSAEGYPPEPVAAAPIFHFGGRQFNNLADLQKAMQAQGFVQEPSGLGAHRIQDLLGPAHKKALDAKIKHMFHQYAGTDQLLDPQEMAGLVACLAYELQMPQNAFGDLAATFDRYDFSGDGRLDEKESIMLINGMLRKYRDKSAPAADVPNSSELIPWQQLQQSYQLNGDKPIGKGGQGEIWLVTDKSNGKTKVAKYYEKSCANMGLDDIIDEFALLTHLDHPRIQRTYEIFQDNQRIYLISEPYMGGDLSTVKDKAWQHGVAPSQAWLTAIWRQVLEGMVYLHSNHVMHCDLKEPNVMITGDQNWAAPNVVVIDLGCAKNFLHAASQGPSGTPGFMPPEVWQGGAWTPKGDVFSLGVMFYRMTLGDFPFPVTPLPANADQAALVNAFKFATVHGQMPAQRVDMDAHLYRVLTKMLAKNFRERPTLKVVLEDAHFGSAEQKVERTGLRRLTKLASCGEMNEKLTALMVDVANNENLAEMEEFAQLFSALDADHDGNVTPNELRNKLKGKMNADQIENLIKTTMGADRCIEYTKFMAHMLVFKKQESITMTLHHIFQELDKDKSGSLDIREVTVMLKRPAVATVMAGKTVEQLMREMDTNGDGKISWEEFRAYLDDRCATNKVEYFSSTHNTWIPTQIIGQRPDGSIQVQCKPGWIDVQSQASKIRRNVRNSSK